MENILSESVVYLKSKDFPLSAQVKINFHTMRNINNASIIVQL